MNDWLWCLSCNEGAIACVVKRRNGSGSCCNACVHPPAIATPEEAKA